MAQSLKAGEKVTVSKDVSFEPNSPEYKNGLRTIKVGEIGTVVDAATGRSLVVEFGGKRITIGSQRLERVTTPTKAPAATTAVPTVKPTVNTQAANSAKSPQAAVSKPVSKQAAADKEPAVKSVTLPPASPSPEEEGNTELVATLANSVLLSGGLKSPRDTVLQIRLTDLPRKLQARITELVQAKLDLGTKKSPPAPPKSETSAPGKKPRRRGKKSAV